VRSGDLVPVSRIAGPTSRRLPAGISTIRPRRFGTDLLAPWQLEALRNEPGRRWAVGAARRGRLARRPGRRLAGPGHHRIVGPVRGYAAALRTHLPGAVRVLDPFHVTRLALSCLDDVRRRVQQETTAHKVMTLYRLPGPRRADRARRGADPGTAVLPDPRTGPPGPALHAWRGELLAAFTHPDLSNGPDREPPPEDQEHEAGGPAATATSPTTECNYCSTTAASTRIAHRPAREPPSQLGRLEPVKDLRPGAATSDGLGATLARSRAPTSPGAHPCSLGG
jgi:hypothetical protein